MGYSRKDVEKSKMNAKKFVRYQEGAEKYSLGLTKFQELAKEAKAVYKIDKVALVNCEIFERYLESFHILITKAINCTLLNPEGQILNLTFCFTISILLLWRDENCYGKDGTTKIR